jgi:hypothetical protein
MMPAGSDIPGEAVLIEQHTGRGHGGHQGGQLINA